MTIFISQVKKTHTVTELQKENEFYKSHFSILQKNFRNVYERLRSEAFYIRMYRPNLNIQTNTWKYFCLF
jgi:chaperonin cofactor prefoldin